MPSSYSQGKKIIIEWIKKYFSLSSRILDVGPGVGTYSNILCPLGYKLDCLEIYEPYILKYSLKDKYTNVFLGDVVKFDIKDYDLVIFGDVLEHLSYENADNILKKLIEKNIGLVISVPFMYEQGSWGGNIYETHLQPDLNLEVMTKRYPYLQLLKVDGIIGVYCWKKI